MRVNCDVIVSGGLGCSIMPFRLGVPPEIVLVTLGGSATAVSSLG
jgi:predicted MPP superfamily phosphohydrolase